jgi:mono/diheme cytochrome c family protein
MRWFLLIYVLVAVMCVGLFGWKGQKSVNRPFEVFQDMDHQEKVKPQTASDFFADGQSDRPPVPGTIAMGREIPVAASAADGSDLPGGYFRSGRFGDFFGEGFPSQVKVTPALLERGQERFGIYCAVCHGHAGDGKGVVGPYWTGGMMPVTANLVDDRVKALPEGQIFWTITHGKGLMGPYGGSIPVEDRWAIVAYLRTLQQGGKARSGAGTATPTGGAS